MKTTPLIQLSLNRSTIVDLFDFFGQYIRRSEEVCINEYQGELINDMFFLCKSLIPLEGDIKSILLSTTTFQGLIVLLQEFLINPDTDGEDIIESLKPGVACRLKGLYKELTEMSRNTAHMVFYF